MIVALVVVTFLVSIAVSLALEARRLRRVSQEPSRAVPSRAVLPVREEDLTVPQGLFLDGAHTWIGLHTAGLATVGVDGFLAKAVGSALVAGLPRVGQQVRRGDEIVRLECDARALSVPSPLDGVVATVNSQLARDPGVLQTDPYSRGWVCTVRPSHLGKTIRSWRIAEDASQWLRQELLHLREFLTGRTQRLAAGATSLDGGDVAEGVLQELDQEGWDTFRDVFLQRHPLEE